MPRIGLALNKLPMPPNGVIVAEAATLGDEVLVADCDLELCRQGKSKMFDMGAHRQPAQYGAITGRAGVVEPA